DAAATAAARGFSRVLGSNSREERGAAYSPLMDGLWNLRQVEPGRNRPAARALHAVLADSRADADVEVSQRSVQIDRRRVTDALLQLLAETSTGWPVIMEDVHWADHATMRI